MDILLWMKKKLNIIIMYYSALKVWLLNVVALNIMKIRQKTAGKYETGVCNQI